MWKVNEVICLLILLFFSIMDIQMRKVSVYMLAAAGAGSILYQLLAGKMNLWLLAGGCLIGVSFVLLSKITDEGIGYGDSIGILVLGIFLGFWRGLTVISTAFFLLLCVLIPVMWKKRMSRKAALPFYPFLTGGYLCLMIMEKIS